MSDWPSPGEMAVWFHALEGVRTAWDLMEEAAEGFAETAARVYTGRPVLVNRPDSESGYDEGATAKRGPSARRVSVVTLPAPSTARIRTVSRRWSCRASLSL